jgi:alkanesulfonate monooxygenase SsuD/methylene tetrahydromethanopterin reductase-like flavin-dependent oxidoreductase (luciferase family)
VSAPQAKRQIHLAAHFPGVNNTTIWSDPASGSQIDFDSFVHLAQVAEAAKFDFFFLAEGQRMREHFGRLTEIDVAGRPDNLTVLAALAAVTDRIGLMPTITTTYHEPHELARQLGTVDLLSGGRAAWNLVTSTDPFTGANFRRGGYLPYDARYERAAEFIEAAWAMWDGGQAPFDFAGTQVDVHGEFSLPRLPQGRPPMIQAGDSEAGREFAARYADGIFTRHGKLEDGQAFYADVKGRLARYGKREDQLLILPGATFVLGDNDAEAQDLAVELRREQISGHHARMVAEQLWNRDLSEFDPEGPLPDVEPELDSEVRSEGSAQARTLNREAVETIARWRERAEAGGLSLRGLVTEMTARQTFVGSPASVAEQLDVHVQGRACDGFILVPHLTPGGLDRFAAEVVPLLQERGSFRSDYSGPTLRDHLGLDPG